MQVINLALRGLQVYTTLCVAQAEGPPTDSRTVPLDSTDHGVGWEHDRGCNGRQPVHHQLHHVCRRVWDAVALLFDRWNDQ